MEYKEMVEDYIPLTSEKSKNQPESRKKIRKRKHYSKDSEGVSNDKAMDELQRQRFHFLSMTAYDRHKRLINQYLLCRKGATYLLKRDTSRDKRDIDVIRENICFLWDEDDVPDTWEARLAKKYYDKLFKEYCICDLSHYKENKVALRWRIEKEVVEGTGQFSCGDKRCTATEGLRTWEVNFGYMERGKKKNALVKLRLCPECSYKLNYHHKKKEVTKGSKKRRKSVEDGDSNKKPRQDSGSEVAQATSESSEDIPVSSSIDTVEIKKEPVDEDEERSVWKQAGQLEEKSREDEFEQYLEDLFL